MILALGAIVNAGTGTSGAVLDMTGHTGVKFINSTLSVGLGIGLNLLLIPPLGVVGAAIAAFGAVSLVNLLRLAEVLWLVGVGPYNATFAKPLVAGAAAALAAVLIASVLAAQPLLLRAGAGILVLMGGYAGLLLLMGLSDDDRLLLARAANRMRRVRGGRNTREPPQITEADAAAGAGPQSLR